MSKQSHSQKKIEIEYHSMKESIEHIKSSKSIQVIDQFKSSKSIQAIDQEPTIAEKDLLENLERAREDVESLRKRCS